MEKQGKDKTGKRTVIVSHTIKTQLDPEIPGPLPYQFPNIYAWLENICLNPPPHSPVEEYQVGLTFGENHVTDTKTVTLSLYGWDTLEEDESTMLDWISFEPSKPHMQLPEDYWTGLDKKALNEKIMSEIETFFKSSIFASSFMTKAKSIIYRTNGQKLWQTSEKMI